MAILGRARLLPQERFDLEDLLAIQSLACADDQNRILRFWANTQYIVKGFEASGVGGASPALVTLDGATLINANNSGDFSWFTGASGASAIQVNLNSSSRNFLELELSTLNGTPLTKTFWDKAGSSGDGVEFQQVIDTITNIQVDVIVLLGGFSGSTDRIPLAIVDTDGSNNITGILDKRPMFSRLGTPADPQANFPWVSQSEPEITLTLSGVAGTYLVGETVTFTSGASAEVTVGGTTVIKVILRSSDSMSAGDTVTGGLSTATGTLDTFSDAFTGADKSLGGLRDNIAALESQVKAILGTRFWFSAPGTSLAGIFNQVNSVLAPITSRARWAWSGSALSLTDDNGAPAGADIPAKLRRFSSSAVYDLTRQDGTGGSSTLAVADGEVLFVTLTDDGTDRAFSGAGAGDTNYKTVASASFVPSDENYWLAYREGGLLIVRGVGELKAGEEVLITDDVPATLLNILGLADEKTAFDYTDSGSIPFGDIRGTVNEPANERIGQLSDNMGDHQEDRGGYLRSDDVVDWDGSSLSFTADIVLELINTKNGTLTKHNVLVAGSPISLADGESAYVSIDRTQVNENVSVVLSGTTPIPAQSNANKDVFVLFRRLDANSVAYLHVPFHKQLLRPGQRIRLGATEEIPTLFVQTGTLAAGATTITLDQPIELNLNSSQQVGAMMVWIGGNPNYRNTNNSSTLGNGIEGDFYEVDAGGGLSTSLEVNFADSKDREFIIFGNRARIDQTPGDQTVSISTTDATPTDLFTLALSDDTVYRFDARIVARRTNAADRAIYQKISCIYRETAGSATLQGSVQDGHSDVESDASWDVTWVVSGNNAILRVTGAGGQNITWQAVVKRQQVG